MPVSYFNIVPEGIHPLLIGMNRRQVEEVMGEAPKISKSRIAGEEVLRFTYARVVIGDDRVVEISLFPHAGVLLRDKSLFDDADVWRELVATDGDAQESLGFIVLRRLGLTLTGFHGNDSSQLAITAFEPGRWDVMAEDMKPFNLDAHGD